MTTQLKRIKVKEISTTEREYEFIGMSLDLRGVRESGVQIGKEYISMIETSNEEYIELKQRTRPTIKAGDTIYAYVDHNPNIGTSDKIYRLLTPAEFKEKVQHTIIRKEKEMDELHQEVLYLKSL